MERISGRRARVLLAGVVLAAGIQACGDGTGVRPFRLTHLSVFLALEDAGVGVFQEPAPAPGRLRVEVRLALGRDFEGGPVVLEHDTLRMFGRPLPVVFRDDREVVWRLEEALPGMDFATVPLTLPAGPALTDREPAFLPESWRGFGRGGPREVTLAAGQDLRLGLVLPILAPDPTPPPDTVEWRLTLEEPDSAPFVILEAPGVPPEELRVPEELLPDAAEFTVRLEGRWSLRRPPLPGRYGTDALLVAVLGWHVTRQGGGG